MNNVSRFLMLGGGLLLACLILLVSLPAASEQLYNVTVVETGDVPSGTEAEPGYVFPKSGPGDAVVQTFVATHYLPDFDHYSCLMYCDHDNREFDWTITGGAYDILDQGNPGQSSQWIEIEFQDAAEYTVQCEVGELPPDPYDWCGPSAHESTDHSGGTASTNVAIWYLSDELDLSNPNPVRGDEVTISPNIVGPVQAISTAGGIYTPYHWKSQSSSLWGFGEGPELAGDYSEWTGPVVIDTEIMCTVTIAHPYKSPSNHIYSQDLQHTGQQSPTLISVQPRAWSTEPSFQSDAEPDWQHHPLYAFGFPMNRQPKNIDEYNNSDPQHYSGEWSDYNPQNGYTLSYWAHGQNTNSDTAFNTHIGSSREVFTPIYDFQYCTYEDFFDFVTEIVTGPNEGCFYIDSQDLYVVDRISRYNYWTRPSAPTPSCVDVHPPPQNLAWCESWGDPEIDNYWMLQGIKFDSPACGMSFPGNSVCKCEEANCVSYGHSRWEGLKQHEEYGPNWPQDYRLGHQARIEWKIENSAYPLEDVDAAFGVEDSVALDISTLRLKCELVRQHASSTLADFTAKLDHPVGHPDGYVLGPDTQDHNWHKELKIFRNHQWRWVVIGPYKR